MPASTSVLASLSGVCPPNCTITPASVPLDCSFAHDLQHVFGRQRLEIEPVGGVVIGRDGFGIAVDHDGLEAARRQREGGVAAAIVELDALADAVRPAAQDDDLLLVGRLAFAFRRRADRRFIGRIHVGRERREFGGAGVDALEHRPHAELRRARRARLFRLCPVSVARRASEKPIALSRRRPSASSGRPSSRHFASRRRRWLRSRPGTTDRIW